MAKTISWADWVARHQGIADDYAAMRANPFSQQIEGGFSDTPTSFDPIAKLKASGLWDLGFRPGMDLPEREDDGSLTSALIEMGTPFAVMGATALGGNALFGPGGVLSGTAAGAGSGIADAMALEQGLAAYTPDFLMGGASAGASGAAGAADYFASLDAADAALGSDMLNLAGTQGVDLSPLWSTNVFGPVGGAASSLGLGSLISGIGSGIKDVLGGVKNLLPSGSTLDTALATAPVLAAINYAKNQSPFDTSRLEATYDQFSPDALAYEFDQNTARGRDALTSSLTNRGVMGSSFGNMDLTNFSTSRDLGRRSLINQGLAQRGNIASSILDAKVKERGLKNDLYGRSLLALGNIFGGRNQAPVYP